jgi:hypothetical protein
MTTATKAVAGGIAANMVTIALWLLSLVPGWATVPDEPKAAIIALVSGAIGAAVVYYAPANATKVTTDATDQVDAQAGRVVTA